MRITVRWCDGGEGRKDWRVKSVWIRGNWSMFQSSSTCGSCGKDWMECCRKVWSVRKGAGAIRTLVTTGCVYYLNVSGCCEKAVCLLECFDRNL